jgi:CRP-like cAMP-binding protein
MDCRNCPNKKCFINSYCLHDWLNYTQNVKVSKYISASETIFSEGDLVGGLYVMCSGKAKVVFKNSEAQKHIIRIAGKGQLLGHRGLSDKMVYPISAKTLTESEIAFISNEYFFKLIRANKDLAFYMMMFFAEELMSTEQKYIINVLQSSNEKVAAALVKVINAFGYIDKKTNKIDLGMNLQDLANFSMTSYSVLTKTLDFFSIEEIIENSGNDFYVLNEPALRNLARIEY